MRPIPHFILASVSPRRSELLAERGFEFTVVSPSTEETLTCALTVSELTLLNATRKALAISRSHFGAVVLAADTLVTLAGEIIGKPSDMREAHGILRRLSGRTHQVCTAVCIARANHRRSFIVTSEVRFRRLGEDTITSYLRRIDPLDKAGAYAAQAHGREIIARINGSLTNVIGLPMEETTRLLREFGVRPRCQSREVGIETRRTPRALGG